MPIEPIYAGTKLTRCGFVSIKRDVINKKLVARKISPVKLVNKNNSKYNRKVQTFSDFLMHKCIYTDILNAPEEEL